MKLSEVKAKVAACEGPTREALLGIIAYLEEKEATPRTRITTTEETVTLTLPKYHNLTPELAERLMP